MKVDSLKKWGGGPKNSIRQFPKKLFLKNAIKGLVEFSKASRAGRAPSSIFYGDLRSSVQSEWAKYRYMFTLYCIQ